MPPCSESLWLGWELGEVKVKADPLEHRETTATTIKIFSIFSFLVIQVSKINYGIA